MNFYKTNLNIQTNGQGLVELTDQINAHIRNWGVKEGMAYVFVPHTSASLVINESYDPSARRDMEVFFDHIAPEGESWHTHTLEGRDDYLTMHTLQQAARRAGKETGETVDALITSIVSETIASPRDLELFARQRARLLDATRRHCAAHIPSLTAPPSFAYADGAVTCFWAADQPTAGRLYYRVNGDAEFRTLDFGMAGEHRGVTAPILSGRNMEWYLLYWNEDGGMAADVSGLSQSGWFVTG